MRKHRIDWTTPAIIERLGVESDGVMAAELGVTRQAVAQARDRLGIASRASRNALPDELLERLGTAKDSALAREYGVERKRVVMARARRGIPAYRLIGPVQVRHGTRYTYSHHACRCTPCTAVNAADMREFNSKNPEKATATRERARAKVMATAPHTVGKIGWYGLGCRCAGCKKAARDYHTDEYKRSRTGSLNY